MAASHKRIAFYQKVLAMLCCCVVALGLVQPPTAHAIAVVDDAYMLVAAYLDACGLSWSLTGVDDKEEFAQAVADMVTSYTGTIGTTVTDWMTTITQASVVGGKLYLSKAQIGQLSAFANWLIGDKGITAGGESVAIKAGTEGFTLEDGTFVRLSTGNFEISSSGNLVKYQVACTSVGSLYEPMSASFKFPGVNRWFGWLNDGSYKLSAVSVPYCSIFNTATFTRSNRVSAYQGSLCDCINYEGQSLTWVLCAGYLLPCWYEPLSSGTYLYCGGLYYALSDLGLTVTKTGGISLAPAQAIDVPDTSTMSDDETLAIDVGATSGTLSDVLTKIWESIQAGTKAATKAVVKGGTATGEVTDVSDLGLPSLAAIITTRFPFSIPWDIAKGIELLAAPPKTPVFTVDFFAPISGLVGGWKGSTELTLDFSKFEKLGALCRWVSTIGFCLFLASATKRLAWTA